MKEQGMTSRFVVGLLIIAGIVCFGLIGKSVAQPKPTLPSAETFDSPNAIYDGDFEDLTPSGWAGNDMIQSIYSPLGWSSSRLGGLTRDAHAGKFAYAASAFANTLEQALDFNPAGLDFTLSGWIKGNAGGNAARIGQVTLSYLTADGNTHSLILRSGQDEQPALTDQYQKYAKTSTFPVDMTTFVVNNGKFQSDPKGSHFQICLEGATGGRVIGNPVGSTVFFDDLALTFPTHPIVKQPKLTTDPVHSHVPDNTANNKIFCPATKTTVDFTHPNCFTKDDELSAVYVRLTVLPGSPNLDFRMSGKMFSYYIPTRYLSLFPGYLLSDVSNSDMALIPGSTGASTGWFKIAYPYVYLNALDDSSAQLKDTTRKSLVLFTAMNNGVSTLAAKFRIDVASDPAGSHILRSKTIDGSSTAEIIIPRHLPASGAGITFPDEEADLAAQAATLNLASSTNQADKLTEVPFVTGDALGKDFLDNSLYDQQTTFLRRLGINGVGLNMIMGPQTKTEKQQEAQHQGFANNITLSFLNTVYTALQFDFPLDQTTIDKALKIFKGYFSGYDITGIRIAFVFEEPSPKPIADYVNSIVAEASFRRYLEALGLKPQYFRADCGDWGQVNMVLPENADADSISAREWFYTAKFRAESMTRFASAVADGLKGILPKASLVAAFSDAYQLYGNAIRHGTFWPSYARNSRLNSMPTGFWANGELSTMVSSYSSAIMRSGLTKNDFDLTALIAPESSWTADDMKLQIYSSLLSGAKEYWFFNYGPSYLPVTDSASTNTSKLKIINDVANEFVPVQAEIKNANREEVQTAILYSETADIWQWANDAKANVTGNTTLDREREGLFCALENNQVSVDVVSEENIALDNALSQYKVLYLVGANIPTAIQAKIAAWVQAGGTVYASMGAGSKDEFNQDTTTLSDVLGVSYAGLSTTSYINGVGAVPHSGSVCQAGHELHTLANKSYKLFTIENGRGGTASLYGQGMQMDAIKLLDGSTQIVTAGKARDVVNGKASSRSTDQIIFTKHQAGSGTAYYCNVLAGLSYAYKAAVAWRADNPTVDPRTKQVIAYPQSSFIKYPGDAELDLIMTPFISSGIGRKVEITDAQSKTLEKQIQTAVLSGSIAGKAYALIPLANFNQQYKTVRIKINIAPQTVLRVTSVAKGNLPFTKGVGYITLDSPLALGLTDILKVDILSP